MKKKNPTSNTPLRDAGELLDSLVGSRYRMQSKLKLIVH
jgi:hypothetical protein